MHERRFRSGLAQRMSTLLAAIAFAGMGVVGWMLGGPSVWPGAMLLPASLAAAGFVAQTRFRVAFDEHGVTWRLYRSRRLAWDDVLAVDEGRVWGNRSVRFLLTDGSVVDLCPPFSGAGRRDPDFERTGAAIHHAWAAATGLMPVGVPSDSSAATPSDDIDPYTPPRV